MMNYLKRLNEKMYALVVIDEDGIVASLAYNASIADVTDIETWFNFSKLGENGKLVRFTREYGKLWQQQLNEHDRSEWTEVK